jgi:murein L,D-transpeptidase YafK
VPEALFKNILEKLKPLARQYIDKSTVRNIFYMTAAMLLFMFGVLLYGIILNIREMPLAEWMREKGYSKLANPNIIVDKNNYTLNLFEDTVLVKSYRVSFGRNVHQAKNRAGDEATPIGEYKICAIDSSEFYTLMFRLNYPNIDDASEALRKGWISQKEFNQIKFEFYYEGCTKFNKILGGEIGIHGIGRLNYIFKNLPFVYNWTNGSIAMSDEDIGELYSVVKIGTKVVIK